VNFLESLDLQVGSAVIALSMFAWLTWTSIKNAESSVYPTLQQTNNLFRVLAIFSLFAIGWIIYSFPFFLFALASGHPPLDAFKLVFNPFFLLFASLPPISALITRSKVIGGLLGGGVPFGILAVFLISNSIPQSQWLGSPLAYLVLGMIFGGTIGALTGPATIKLTRALGLPLPIDLSPITLKNKLSTSSSHDTTAHTLQVPIRDVFISHASEDKEEIARPLVETLKKRGLSVWFDEYELTLGDPLRRKIEEGLRVSRFGVAILSENFFHKRWPQQELDALFAQEDQSKKILPVWHRLSATDIAHYAPLLADRLAVSTDKGLDRVADDILRAVTQRSKGYPIHRESA
jgi:hypothetical protein